MVARIMPEKTPALVEQNGTEIPRNVAEELPPHLEKFVQALFRGQRPVDAAGYAGSRKRRDDAALWMLDLRVQAAIVERAQGYLLADGVPAALRYLVSVIRGRKYSERAKMDAAKTLLDRAGFIPPKAADPQERGQKPLSRMSQSELLEMAQQAQRELSNRAEVIDVSRHPGAQPKRKGAELLD